MGVMSATLKTEYRAAAFVRDLMQQRTVESFLKRVGWDPVNHMHKPPPHKDVKSTFGGIEGFVERWYTNNKPCLIVLESNYTASGTEFEFSEEFFAKMPEAYFILTSQRDSSAAKSFLSTSKLENVYKSEWMKSAMTSSDSTDALDSAKAFLTKLTS
jgi:hypothetical protein